MGFEPTNGSAALRAYRKRSRGLDASTALYAGGLVGYPRMWGHFGRAQVLEPIRLPPKLF